MLIEVSSLCWKPRYQLLLVMFGSGVDVGVLEVEHVRYQSSGGGGGGAWFRGATALNLSLF